jgi:hypothetical protein
VAISWIEQAREFKSPLRIVPGFLLRSRETKAAQCRQLRDENNKLKRQLDRQTQQLQQRDREIAELKRRIEKLEMEQQARSTTSVVTLPDDPPIGSHGYGARMVALAVNLARSVGLRGAARVLKTFFQWLGIPQKTPIWTTIRNWLARLGIAALKKPIEPANDWIWLADHSNQIGPEKALVMLGVRASQLPEPGTALKHENVRILRLQPGTEWKREDMAKVYQEVAEASGGTPRAVLVDGAVELREGADCLKTGGSETIVLRDFKHYAANVVKSLIGNDERFQEFSSKVGQTRSAIQQTELAHLTPPGSKPKSRFMNLARTLHWAGMASWLLAHPEAKSRGGLTNERLEQKLGWLRDFGDDWAVWQECQHIISSSVTFINEQGLYRGASAALRTEIATALVHETSKQLAERLIQFVDEAEQQLKEGERLPLSTEILESSFSLYKQLERQHSKGGFTGLLTTFAALLKPTSPEAVRKALAEVSTKDVKAWVAKHLGTTLTSRRRAVETEYAKATKRATIQPGAT